MNWKFIMIVLKKEIKDLFRDKKTIFSSILLPALIIPVMMALVSKGAENVEKKAVENVKIVIKGEDNIDAMEKFLKENIWSQSEDPIEIVKIENEKEALQEDDIRLILEFDKNFLENIENNQTGKIKMIYNNTSSKSELVSQMVMGFFQQYKEKLVYERVTAQGIDAQILEGLHIEKEGVGGDSAMIGRMLSTIIPLFLVLFPLTGAMTAATDLIAGEKERKTLEPLLTTQPGRISLIVGKLLTTTTFSVLSVLAVGTGLMVAIQFMLPKEAMDLLSKEGITFSPMVFILIILIGILLSVMYSAILLSISTFARSYKEAQSYMAPVMIVVMVPIYMVMMWDVSDFTNLHFSIPVLNAVALIKELFINPEVVWSHVALTMGSTFILVVFASFYCVYMFNREEALFRS